MTLSTEILTRSPLLSADELEGEIGDIISRTRRGPVLREVSESHDRPLPKGPMPDYVEHKEGVNQVGKLSAEAVVREYDAAVKAKTAHRADYGTGTLCGVPGGPHWHQHFSTGTEPLRYLAIVPRGDYEEKPTSSK